MGLAGSSAALAQKGMGDPVGMARQDLRPAMTQLSGVVLSVETHPCEQTTGRAVVGTHVILRGSDGQEYNVHLGPAQAVASLIAPLEPGRRIGVAAFRTDKMAQNHYVATTLVQNGRTVELRDASLRPVWSQGNRRQADSAASLGATGGFVSRTRYGGHGQQLGPGRGRGRGFGPAFGGRGFGRARRGGCRLQ